MNYEIHIPNSVRAEISSWGFPPALHAAFYEAIIDELSETPLNGFRSVAPVVFQTHRFGFNCPMTGNRLEFTLWVNETMRIGIRKVLQINREP